MALGWQVPYLSMHAPCKAEHQQVCTCEHQSAAGPHELAAQVERTCIAAAVSGALSSGGGLAHLTAGYSLVTWLVVANLGFTGLLVSWVMKFADSIMKVEERRMLFGLGLVSNLVDSACHQDRVIDSGWSLVPVAC
jgi:Nucleotide-sugar transporter